MSDEAIANNIICEAESHVTDFTSILDNMRILQPRELLNIIECYIRKEYSPSNYERTILEHPFPFRATALAYAIVISKHPHTSVWVTDTLQRYTDFHNTFECKGWDARMSKQCKFYAILNTSYDRVCQRPMCIYSRMREVACICGDPVKKPAYCLPSPNVKLEVIYRR